MYSVGLTASTEVNASFITDLNGSRIKLRMSAFENLILKDV